MKKSGLQEVYYFRALLVICLVTMHSFNMFTGSPSWPLPEGIQPVPAYNWISKGAYSFMLESFVFISGYIFSYQLYGNRKEIHLKGLVKGKLQRLIMPCILFGVLYLLCFDRESLDHLPQTLYILLCGVAHLWFLPMLFWCFIFSYFLAKVKEPSLGILYVLLGLSIFSFLPLPFQLSNSLFFMFYFYLGMYCWKEREQMMRLSNQNGVLIGLWGGYFLTFASLTLIKESLFINVDTTSIMMKAIMIASGNLFRLIYGIMGLIASYLTFLRIAQFRPTPRWMVYCGGLSMGIYIFHQFVLVYLYYHTEVSSLAGTYSLPFIGLFVSLLFSLLLTYFIRLNKIGRKII